MYRRAISSMVWITALVGGCVAEAEHRPVPPPAPVSEPLGSSPADEDAAAVSVAIRGPLQVRWAKATMGPSTPSLAVVVTNRGSSALDVSDLRVHATAIRETVPFRCANHRAASETREPKVIPPGATVTYERPLECVLPLAGSYTIRVGVSFGSGSWKTARQVRAFELRVAASNENAPRRVEPIPGLWAAIGAAGVMAGRPGHASGRIVVALVNGGRTPLELPRFRLGLRVYRVGVPIPCEDAPVEMAAPAVLGVGASYSEPVEVSCLGLGTPGRYDVAGRLEVGTGSQAWEVELGRLRIDISDDPPEPMQRIPSMGP